MGPRARRPFATAPQRGPGRLSPPRPPGSLSPLLGAARSRSAPQRVPEPPPRRAGPLPWVPEPPRPSEPPSPRPDPLYPEHNSGFPARAPRVLVKPLRPRHRCASAHRGAGLDPSRRGAGTPRVRNSSRFAIKGCKRFP